MKNLEAVLFYLTFFVLILALMFSCNVVNSDLWARLLQGDYFLQTGHIMYSDPFSYVKVHSWIDHEWGSSVVFSFIKNIFGYNGLIWLKAILMFLTFIFIFQIIKLNGLKSTKLYNLLFFFFVINSFETVLLTGIRCHCFTYMFFSCFLYILEKVRKDNANKLLFLLPPIMLIWSNMHGGCVSGIGLLILYIIGETLNRKPVKQYLYALICTILPIFVNPYGLSYVKFLLEATTMTRTYIAEWQNLFETGNLLIKSKIFVIISIATTIITLFKQIKKYAFKIDYTKYIIIFVTCFLALSHIKHLPFFLIASTAFLYDDFFYIFNKIMFNFIKSIEKIKEVLVYGFVILGSISVLFVNYNNSISEVSLKQYPVKVVEFMKINKLNGTILNKFDIGSYLAYKLYPQNLIYMDGRYEEVYYDNTTEDNYNFYTYYKTPFRVFNKTGFPDYIIVNKVDPIYKYMSMLTMYKEIFSEDNFSLYIRTDIKRNEYKSPKNDNEYYIKTFF